MSWPTDAEVEIKQNESYRSFAANRFEVFKDDLEEDIEEAETGDSQWRMFRKIEVLVGAVKALDYKLKLSRESKMRFNVAKVQKPLASVAKVVEAGNMISMGPNPEDNFIENTTGERIGLKVEKGTFVFDVEFKDCEAGTITLDSWAVVNVWPMDVQSGVSILPRDPRLRMTAANGSEIQNLGVKMIEFRGVEPDFRRQV